MPSDPAKTDEPGTAESHGGGGERKRFLRIIINVRAGPGANDFIAKCITAGINDPAIIPSFSFLCASDSCGKAGASGARGNAPRALQCNRFVKKLLSN